MEEEAYTNVFAEEVMEEDIEYESIHQMTEEQTQEPLLAAMPQQSQEGLIHKLGRALTAKYAKKQLESEQ